MIPTQRPRVPRSHRWPPREPPPDGGESAIPGAINPSSRVPAIDNVDVDVSRSAKYFSSRGSTKYLPNPRSGTLAHHDLGRVQLFRDVDNSIRDPNRFPVDHLGSQLLRQLQ